MGSEFQDLYKKGGTPWAIKFFKERILTSLVEDLLDREKDGIKSEICKSIIRATEHTIEGVNDIKDGGFWYLNFHEKLMLFLKDYSAWNKAETHIDRMKCLRKLRKTKSEIFQDFYDYQNDLKKQNNSKRLDEFNKLLQSEIDIHAYLNQPFRKLVNNYGEIFPNLAEALKVFDKRT